ncbi:MULTISPECIES: NINE protein [unclassified Gilliamella]|jgi:TM2 domain-containing membrane protein YozV|uniref:NINE protein n=1 Tax=unclassified Gilliamella TaxID=2685620 RepID=UPI00114706C9|nr:NINE protein [Gilliamella apicola]
MERSHAKQRYCLFIVVLFGFMGIHRMYCGKWITGFVWLFTCGVFGIGWFLDLFLTSGMVDYANLIDNSKFNKSQNVTVNAFINSDK